MPCCPQHVGYSTNEHQWVNACTYLSEKNCQQMRSIEIGTQGASMKLPLFEHDGVQIICNELLGGLRLVMWAWVIAKTARFMADKLYSTRWCDTKGKNPVRIFMSVRIHCTCTPWPNAGRSYWDYLNWSCGLSNCTAICSFWASGLIPEVPRTVCLCDTAAMCYVLLLYKHS